MKLYMIMMSFIKDIDSVNLCINVLYIIFAKFPLVFFNVVDRISSNILGIISSGKITT